MTAHERLSDRALNRALLARQGLLERFDAPLVEVVEARIRFVRRVTRKSSTAALPSLVPRYR